MRKIFTTLFLLICTVNTIYSQSIWESLIEVKNLIKEDKDSIASSILNKIESQCLNSNNDSIRVLYFESKGITLWSSGKYEECIPYFQKTIELYENLHIKAQNYLEAFVAIGYSYGRLKDYYNAERFYRKALLKSVAAQYNKDFRPYVYKNLGNLYLEKGDSLLAKECYKRVGDADVEAFDFMNINHIEWESSYYEKLNRLFDSKQYEEAANLFVPFIKEIKAQKGNKNKSYVLAVYGRAILLSRYLNNQDDAIPLFKELVCLSDSLSEPDESVCGAFCNLTLYCSMNGDISNLKNTIFKGIRYLQKANIEDYPPHMIYRFAGNGAYWQKDYSNAIKYYELYLDSSNKREKGSNYEEIINQLSVSYLFSENPVKAKSLLLDFLKTDETRLKTDNVSVLSNIYHNLGRAIMLLDSKSEALKFLNKSKELQMDIFGEVSERTLQYIKECSSK